MKDTFDKFTEKTFAMICLLNTRYKAGDTFIRKGNMNFPIKVIPLIFA